MSDVLAQQPRRGRGWLTGLAAFLALIISMSSCGYHTYHQIRGPQIDVFPPEQIRLFGYKDEAGKFDRLGVVLGLELMNSSPLEADVTVNQSIRIVSSGVELACLDSRAIVSYKDGPTVAESTLSGSRNLYLLGTSTKTEMPPGKFVELRLLFDQRATTSNANPCYGPIGSNKFSITNLMDIPEQQAISFKIDIQLLHSPDVTLTCKVAVSKSAYRHLTTRGEIVLPCGATEVVEKQKSSFSDVLRRLAG